MSVRDCCRRLLFAAAAALLAASPGAARECASNATTATTQREGPAATLLFPYFEVDLDGGRTTLLSIVNTDVDANRVLTYTLARVTLWTDWAIPTLSFDLYLSPGDVQTINLRELFATGRAPVTVPPAGRFSGCAASLGGALAAPSVLQNQHTGRPSTGFCFASPRADTSLATGYVTVDVVRRCSPPIDNPARAGYFTGSSRIAAFDNRLWGDWLLVDPDANLASGQPAVSIFALPSGLVPGDYTFYGRYLGFSSADRRLPLQGSWAARYVTGGSFDGGTDLLVWRDNRSASISPRPCGSAPTWAPLGENAVTAHSETGARQDLGGTTHFFPLATQRVDVATAIAPPFAFGWLRVSLSWPNFEPAQGWMGWLASAESRFGVGVTATPLGQCESNPD